MLQAFPTKNGTGISFFGDTNDLTTLYETVHHFAKTIDAENYPQKARHQVLMNFAYEIRKASYGSRLVEKFQFIGDNLEHTLYGFQFSWPDILIFSNVLRFSAGYCQSDKLHQSILYLFEFHIERALMMYDPAGGEKIKNFIGEGIYIFDKFLFIIYQAVSIEFALAKPGKTRFRSIPRMLREFYFDTGVEYKKLIESLEVSAKEQGCDIMSLEFEDFPEEIW